MRLHKQIGLPLYHLDAIWHRSDRTHLSREEFDARLGEILARDAWILDGHYSRTLERRIAACDTVVLLDLPTELCLEGAIARLGTKRPDLPWIDTELDERLKTEIEQFSTQKLPSVYALLAQYGKEKTVVILHSREEAASFLQRMEALAHKAF